MPVSGGTGGMGRKERMKKQKQNKYGAKCGLSQIGGQVFRQKKKRYDTVVLTAKKVNGC